MLHKNLSKLAFNKCVLNGVLIPTTQAFIIKFDAKCEELFLCNYNPMH